ncbi:MAG: hypothetical protein WCT02_00620 [Candidatus Paceibacterota bacterium]|jgi:hypothetical protein
MNKEQLKQLALDVNILLDKYIAVDKELHKRSASFWSIFTPIPFDLFKDKIEDIADELKLKQNTIAGLVDNKSQVQNQFRKTLLNYTAALINSVTLLHQVIVDLAEASKGSRDRKLSFAEYQSNTQKYQDSMKNYFQYGQRLNRLFDQLDSGI